MDAHRKFTFDDPEDSYWNEQNAAASTSFFADVNSNAVRRLSILVTIKNSLKSYDGPKLFLIDVGPQKEHAARP